MNITMTIILEVLTSHLIWNSNNFFFFQNTVPHLKEMTVSTGTMKTFNILRIFVWGTSYNQQGQPHFLSSESYLISTTSET